MCIDEIIQNSAKQLMAEYYVPDQLTPDNICNLPNRDSIIQILTDIKKVIFPGYFEGETVRTSAVEYYTGHLLTEIYRKLKSFGLNICHTEMKYDIERSDDDKVSSCTVSI